MMHGSDKLWTKPFIFVCLANLFTFFSFQIVVPALPLYLDSIGTDSAQVGLVLASFSLSVLVARPLAGVLLVDRGFDKLCVLLGAIVCLLALGGYWWAPTLIFITMARLIHGAGFGFSSVAYGAMVARLVPAHRRAEGMSYFALSVSLGLCLGPIGGTYSMEYFNFSYTLLFCSVFLALSVIWLLALPSWRPMVPPTRLKLSWKLFFEKSVWFPCFLCGLFGVAYGPITAFITLWGKGVGINNVGAFFLLNACCSLVVRLFAGRVADTMGRSWIILPACIVNGLSLLILQVFDGYSAMVWSAICMGLGMGSGYPVLQAWVIELVSEERRGAATAFFYNAFDLGIGISIIVWGVVASFFGYATMYGIASLSMLLFLVCYLGHLFNNRNRKKV